MRPFCYARLVEIWHLPVGLDCAVTGELETPSLLDCYEWRIKALADRVLRTVSIATIQRLRFLGQFTEYFVMYTSPSKKPFACPATAYSLLIILLIAMAMWLTYDFWRERERTLEETSRLAMHKSQLISSLFGDTFIAADYVLRDVTDHIDMAIANQSPLADLTPLLEKKLATVPALTQLAILDENCIFTAMGKRVNLLFKKSNQSFCLTPNQTTGTNLHVQYMPAEKSANGKPVVLMSRVIYSKQGRIQAAAMAVIELDYAQHWIETFAVNRYDVQTIIDREGVVIARNPARLKDLGKRTVAPLGQPMFEHVNGTMTFTATSPLDNRERIFGLSRLEHFPFITIVGYDKSSALKGWQQRAWQFACGYMVLALLSIAFLRTHLKTVEQSRTLNILATTDSLTGIANRRYLFRCGEQETVRAIRYKKPLAILMIDIDCFKKINDHWGHPIGDRVIFNIAKQLRNMLRNTDICGRLGGEEFTAILPETDVQGAVSLAERLRVAVEKSDDAKADDDQVIRHTISIGVASLRPEDSSFEALLQRADFALYQAKESGRNQVAVHDSHE